MEKTKRLFISASILMLSVFVMSARDNIVVEGSFAKIQGIKRFNIEVDWTNIHINGLTPGEWIRYRNSEQPSFDAEEEFQSELKPRWSDMVASSNEKLNKKQVYLLPDASELKYKLIVSPHQIDRNGNLEAFCTIVNKNDEVLVKFVLTGKGGIFGTMSNLWGDGFKSAGKNLAKILEKYLIK